jgi:hypothetical protein
VLINVIDPLTKHFLVFFTELLSSALEDVIFGLCVIIDGGFIITMFICFDYRRGTWEVFRPITWPL